MFATNYAITGKLAGFNMSKNTVYPFNNYVETGLRILTILTASYPRSYDVDHLLYFDFMVVHSADIDKNVPSLHPAVPNRRGEIFVRRSLITTALEIYSHKGLVEVHFKPTGILYSATETSGPFLDDLSEEYTISLIKKAYWLITEYGDYDLAQLRELFERSMAKTKNEFNLEII